MRNAELTDRTRRIAVATAAITLSMFALLGNSAIGHAQAIQLKIRAQDLQLQIMPEAQGVLIQAFPRGAVVPIADDGLAINAGASLKTDPDVEQILEKANRYADDGNYRIAAQLWQVVIDRSGDALYSEDDWIYYSLVNRVERLLADLPAEGLAAYRINADANARQILASGETETDAEALNRVVQQYFLSSVGDDAAFRLGQVYLDQYDFSGALRMFRRIREQFPDPSVPADELDARVALCQLMMGNPEAAQNTVSMAGTRSGDQPDDALRAVESAIGTMSAVGPADASHSRQWSMAMGDAGRMGVMPSLPESAYTGDQQAGWQFFVPPRDSRYSAVGDTGGRLHVGDVVNGKSILGTRNMIEKNIVEAWNTKQWRPSGELLVDEERVYFRAAADIVAFDTAQVDAALQDLNSESLSTDPAPPTTLESYLGWRSLWRNSFEIDETTMFEQAIRKSWSGFNRQRNNRPTSNPNPASFAEVLFFGDAVYQQMSIQRGILYAIEGKRFDERNANSPRRVTPQWNASIRRTRSNSLTAYDAATGRLLWTRPDNVATPITDKTGPPVAPVPGPVEQVVAGDENQQLSGGGFMSAPVAFGKLAIAPVNINGAIYLYGLDPQDDGKTVWHSYLCDEPESGASSWSPIQLSISGSDLFVNCGTGVVFVVDPSSGRIRFARRYHQRGERASYGRQNSPTHNRLVFDGWSSDVVLPWSNQLIVFASDTPVVESIDRSSGEMIWRLDTSEGGSKVDYIIGAWDGQLYLGGPSTILAIDLEGEGRIAWGGDDLFDGKLSRGRAMVTAEGIFVPVEDSIWHYDHRGDGGRGKLLNQFGVTLGTDAPVGNLYSDGRRIWVHGGNRVYALMPVNEQ